MPATGPDILEAVRLPALCRGVCLYAGLPLPPATSSERFVARSGDEPPELLVRLLKEGLVEDGVEVRTGIPGTDIMGPSRITVESGFGAPCPNAEELHRAVEGRGGPVLVFAVERRDEGGRLLGVTWAAVPEEEPPPQERFRAAVQSYDMDTASWFRSEK